MSQQVGFQIEQQAREYLLRQGLEWLKSNYRCRWGEIDLVMREGKYLVFVEVRSRTSVAYGGAAGSITFSKQKKLLNTASHYLLTHRMLDKQPSRFDVVGFQGLPRQIIWIKNVLEAS